MRVPQSWTADYEAFRVTSGGSVNWETVAAIGFGYVSHALALEALVVSSTFSCKPRCLGAAIVAPTPSSGSVSDLVMGAGGVKDLI